ncbi:MAG: S8 family serine peptidase [Alphaproteobacteria bacterium]|nr:S8 family serine peptidase [Alphaproteobacteria bacterium]
MAFNEKFDEVAKKLMDVTLARSRKLVGVDVRDIDLREADERLIGPVANPQEFWGDNSVYIGGWTDDVKWPDASKMPPFFAPALMLEAAKKPEFGVPELHEQGIDGRGIGIAIIDHRLNLEHPEYKDKIKHYEVIENKWDKNGVDYHGSLVVGCAAGENTGTAPGADIYYIAAENWPDKDGDPSTMERFNMAIRKIIDINKNLPPEKKIRFLSCSWGGDAHLFAKETEELFDLAEQNGIMVLGGGHRGRTGDGYIFFNPKYKFENEYGMVGIPTDGKTNPWFLGGYAYDRMGGASSMFPYLAGVFAMALQGNMAFCNQPDWQSKLMEIMKNTAQSDEKGGKGKIINPAGIVKEVARRAREIELEMIKQQKTKKDGK